MKKSSAESDKQKRAEAHFERGDVLYEKERYVEALVEMRAAAALGHGGAMFCVGCIHRDGRGVAKNVAEAHEWYKRAAAAGSLEGMLNLANHFRDGVPEAGIAPNRAEAMRLARKAAEGDHVSAMFNLSKWLGEDNEDDPEQLVWLKRAINKGSKGAMNALGVCYFNGKGGLAKKAATANSWYLKAAEQGSPVAMYNLGASYEDGNGVEKNLATAAEWYERASKAGQPEAPAQLERVKKLIADSKESVQCGACGAPTLNRCSGCMEMFYCSLECQHAHWPEHKAECKAKQAKLKEQEK